MTTVVKTHKYRSERTITAAKRGYTFGGAWARKIKAGEFKSESDSLLRPFYAPKIEAHLAKLSLTVTGTQEDKLVALKQALNA